MAHQSKSILPLPPVSLSDGPLERLRLMEQVQGDRTWLTTVVADEPGQTDQLKALKATLEEGRFHAYLDSDAMGRDVLRVQRVGLDVDFGAGLGKLGLLDGIMHTAQQALQPVCKVVGAGVNVIKDAAAEPNRGVGGLYMIGDFLYFDSEKFTALPKGTVTAGGLAGIAETVGRTAIIPNNLMKLSGLLGIAQSLVLMGFARDDSEYVVNALEKRMQQAVAEGKDPLSPEVWEVDAKEAEGIFSPIVKLLKKYPVPIGASLQIAGQVAMAASAAIKLHNGDVGGNWARIARAALSSTAWTIIMMNEQHYDESELADWKTNPIQRAWQEFRSNPHWVTCGITTAASLAGMASDISAREEAKANAVKYRIELEKQGHFHGSGAFNQYLKDSERSNLAKLESDKITPTLYGKALHVQETEEMLRSFPKATVAEMAYLAGDFAIMFARKANVGSESADASNGAVKAVAHLVHSAPIMFTPSEETDYVHRIAQYVSSATVDQRLENAGEKNPDPVARQQAIDDMAQSIATGVFAELSKRERKIDKVANAIARVADLFPLQQREAVMQVLSVEVVNTMGVTANAPELVQLAKEQHERFTHPAETPLRAPSMAVVAPSLADLTLSLPPMDAAANASRFYDAVLTQMRDPSQAMNNAASFKSGVKGGVSTPSPQERIYQEALLQQVSANTGISATDLRQMVREVVAAQREHVAAM